MPRRLLREATGGDDGELDHVVGRDALAVRADALADALDHRLVVLEADRDGLADVRPAVRLAEIGRRQWRRSVVGLEVGGDRDRDASAGAQRPAGAREEAVALGQ